MSATYFNIHYKDRIVAFYNTFSQLDALTFESILGPVVMRNPPASLIQQYRSLAVYRDRTTVPGPVGALVDGRPRNLSLLDNDGVDASFTFTMPVSRGSLGVGLGGTYILNYETRFSESALIAHLLDTPYNPTRLRLRGQLTWNNEWLTGSVFANHVSSYTDQSVSPAASVASWTTIDLTGSYRCATCTGVFENLAVTLGILNVANKNPPWVQNDANINYDGANANALRRYYSLQLVKSW